MSITVRLWNKKDLKNIQSCKDRFLATIFMNVKTFSEEAIKYYPYDARRTYYVDFVDEEGAIYQERIYATDDDSLKKFLQEEYDYSKIVGIEEETSEYRAVEL